MRSGLEFSEVEAILVGRDAVEPQRTARQRLALQNRASDLATVKKSFPVDEVLRRLPITAIYLAQPRRSDYKPVMATNAARPPRGTKTIALVIGIWLSLAVAAGASGWFERASAPLVAITVWTLTGLTLFFCWAVPVFRRWSVAVDLRWLIMLHLTRFVGFYFLYLTSIGELPTDFAIPAGISDIAVACLAVVLLLFPVVHKRIFLLAWNTIGLFDIIFVVSTALRIGLEDWKSMHALREFPLNLLPTFLVPLIIVSHVLIFIRAARRRVESEE